jgi:two-component system cell cycle sensor histidine kinase/response regulator CckA
MLVKEGRAAMSNPEAITLELFPRLAGELAAADAEAALAGCLRLLSEFGVVPLASKADVAWFSHEHRGRLLELGAPNVAASAEVSEAVHALVRLALIRAVDASEHARLTRDMAERDRVSALLRESESLLRELAERAFDLMVISRDGVVVDVRGASQQLLGYAREHVLDKPVMDFVAGPSRALMRLMLAEERVGSYEVLLEHHDGALVPFQVVAVLSTLDGKPVRVAGLRDLRETKRLEGERRKLEQQVERSQRLQSLGVLAGGIAHDFNNLLVGILGNAELLLERAMSPLDAEVARGIRTAGERAAKLTAQMLAYAGQRDVGRREPIEVSELFREIGGLVSATLSKKAKLDLRLSEGNVVLGDRTTLSQVLMNLLTNASDALGDRPGTIRVVTRKVRELDARWDDALGVTPRPGDWILIEVEDTGEGMDEATLGRIFEPFFTTKHKGHGLGLAACLGILSAHDGGILVESQKGRGSRFSVLFPASERGKVVAAPTPATAPDAPCRVLVVDDEELVRSHVRRALERRGYSVDEASGGHAALAMFEDRATDVIVLDMTMPDLDGVEVVSRLRARGSTVPIVLSSGYLDGRVQKGLEPNAVEQFLMKPFSIEELVEAIHRARAAR